MSGQMIKGFDDVIEAYVEVKNVLLLVVVDSKGRVIKHNRRFGSNLGMEDSAKGYLLGDYYSVEVVADSKLKEFKVKYVELSRKTQTHNKLKGYRVQREGQICYILEREQFINEDMMKQMDTINQELTNLSHEVSKKNYDLKHKNVLITKMMYQDSLTKLNNRRYLYEQFEVLKGRYGYGDLGSMHLVIIDIDHFKRVNDELGHDVGDEVLITFAELISRFTRDEDLKIRFGGDEFMIIFINTELLIIKKRLSQLMKEFGSINLGNYEHVLTASFGIATYSTDEPLETLAMKGNTALNQAKESGRNQFIIFS